MGNGRSPHTNSGQMERLGTHYHQEILKQDLILMARGDHDTPLLSTRRHAATSRFDLVHLATGTSTVRSGASWRLPPA